MGIQITQPSVPSVAQVVAKWGFTPADAGAVVMADGTAAAPGMKFGTTTDLGFYLRSANIMGIAVEGLQHTSFQYQNVLGTNDGALTRMGRSQTFNASAAYAYPVTVFIETMTIGNNNPIVMYDIGLGDLHVEDTVTQTSKSYTTELDKTDIYADAGAVTFSGGFGGCILRVPIAKTDVTLTNAIGLDFTIPGSASVTGTHTNTKLIVLPTSSGGASSTYYGIFQDATYNGGTIGSADGADISLKSGGNVVIDAGVIGAENGLVTINGKNSGGRVYLQQNDRTALEIATVGASLNYVQISANNTPLIMAQHASTANLSLAVSSKGNSALLLGTNGGTTQLSVSHTASAVNLVQITGGASGANARVQSTAENLILGTGGALATNATAGHIMIPGCAGTPTGVPTAAGAGAVALIYDTTNNILYAYDGGWNAV